MTYGSRRSSSRRASRRRAPDTIGINDPYHDSTMRVATIEAVKYDWPQWYTKVTPAEGRVIHYGPWKTEWAARQCARILARLLLQRGQLTGGVHV